MLRRRLYPREKYIFGFCLFIVFVYIGYQFVFLPISREEIFWRSQISAMERQIARDLRILRKESDINGRYSMYLENFEQKGTDMQEMALILSEIESIAKKLNLRIEDMKPRRIRGHERSSHFPVSIRIRATVDSIAFFLYTLQTPPHVFHIEELRLEKPSIRQKDLLCEMIVSRLLIQSESGY